MADSLEKQLISMFATAWNEAAPPLLGQSSALSFLALREVSGDSMTGALAVAGTWSSAFVATCTQGLPGVLVCLFKSEDEAELDRLAKPPTDGIPKPGGRLLVSEVLATTATQLAGAASADVVFSDVGFIDLSVDEARLARIVNDSMWVGTFSLSVGDDINTQVLLLYAPNGTLEATTTTTAAAATDATTATPSAATTPTTTTTAASASSPVASVADTANRPAAASAAVAAATTSASSPQPTRRSPTKREETPRNIERLLDVELEIVVRFGLTNVPLRDVVRMGMGSVIELNRAVDEPVELLVNGRPLARGEVVIVDGHYGVRITEIGTSADRALSLI